MNIKPLTWVPYEDDDTRATGAAAEAYAGLKYRISHTVGPMSAMHGPDWHWELETRLGHVLIEDETYYDTLMECMQSAEAYHAEEMQKLEGA